MGGQSSIDKKPRVGSITTYSRYHMKNCTGKAIHLVDSKGVIVLFLKPGLPSTVMYGDPQKGLTVNVNGKDIHAVPYMYSVATSIRGLPEDDGEDILVPLPVAEAMRAMGIHRSGRVLSPMPEVFSTGMMLVGVPGLVIHYDLGNRG